MSNIIESMERLVNELSKLPSCGKKTAQRYAYYLINASDEVVEDLQTAIAEAKLKIHYCAKCGNFTDKELCDNCSKVNVDPIICVVKEPKDVSALEKVLHFNGTYHVLHGVISPLENKGPNDINLKSLLTRVSEEHIEEVIIATNPDVEGEATAMYIANLLKPLRVKVSRIAQGVAMGSELEFADAVTLGKAIENRRLM
ncbi:MAG: recombination protein RecR [Clostridia bacterium]|nr:recombination protein RecR [Clostridia bacterium]